MFLRINDLERSRLTGKVLRGRKVYGQTLDNLPLGQRFGMCYRIGANESSDRRIVKSRPIEVQAGVVKPLAGKEAVLGDAVVIEKRPVKSLEGLR